MKLIEELTNRELELLKNINIIIEEREYDINEIIDISDKATLDGEISNLNGDNYESTQIANEYSDLIDKLIELENEKGSRITSQSEDMHEAK